MALNVPNVNINKKGGTLFGSIKKKCIMALDMGAINIVIRQQKRGSFELMYKYSMIG